MHPIPVSPNRITFLYDSRCGLCNRFRGWLLDQPRHIETEFLPYDHPRAAAMARGIPPWELAKEIHAVADTGDLWTGGDAWIMALWSTVAYRTLAARMAGPGTRPLAKRIALAIAARRHDFSRMLRLPSASELAALAKEPPPMPDACADKHCKA